MANNLPQLKIDFRTAFGTNLDAATLTKLRNRFVTAYQSEWNARVAAGATDNAANRGIFASDKVFDYIQDIFRSESARENTAAIPPPEVIV